VDALRKFLRFWQSKGFMVALHPCAAASRAAGVAARTCRASGTSGTRGKFAHGNAADAGHQLLGFFGFALGTGERFIGVRRNDFFKNGAALFAFILIDRHEEFSFFLKYIKIQYGKCP
jgi:hypothetical protein